MKFKIDLNSVANYLTCLLVVGAVGFYFDFQGVKAETKQNSKKAQKIDVVAKIVCLQAIENEKSKVERPDGPPPKKKWNAEKICEKIMNE